VLDLEQEVSGFHASLATRMKRGQTPRARQNQVSKLKFLAKLNPAEARKNSVITTR
jgi:hypothetical protein